VPWRFSDAGHQSASIVPLSRHPKTCTQPVIAITAAALAPTRKLKKVKRLSTSGNIVEKECTGEDRLVSPFHWP
jgi:hypothetical protein